MGVDDGVVNARDDFKDDESDNGDQGVPHNFLTGVDEGWGEQ
jgi:hypothetical protein